MNNTLSHYRRLQMTDVILATDICYDDIDHDLLQCPLKMENQAVGNRIVFRREHAGAVPCYDSDDWWYCDGLPF